MAGSTLQELWGFDDTDLASNRKGKLSEKQSVFLAIEHKSQSRVFLGVAGFVIVIFCCLPALLFGSRGFLPLLVSGNLSDLTEPLSAFATGGVALGFVALFALPIVAVVVIYLMRANKKADTSVNRAEGTAMYTWGTKRVRTPTRLRKYEDVKVLHLNLGDKKFEVKEALQELIQEGETWMIYYTSYPFKFLSAEVVSKTE